MARRRKPKAPRKVRPQSSAPRSPNTLEQAVLSGIKKSTKRRNITVSYESERLPYFLAKNYVPDFVCVFGHGGTKLYIEAKGYLRPADRTKMIAVKKANPEADIRFVFAKDNILYKGSKSRYSDWALAHGFPFIIGTSIPKEWFERG